MYIWYSHNILRSMNWKDIYRIEYITALKPDDEWEKEILRSALYAKFPDLKDEEKNLCKMISQKREYAKCKAFYLDEKLFCVITSPELKSGTGIGAYSTLVYHDERAEDFLASGCLSRHQ